MAHSEHIPDHEQLPEVQVGRPLEGLITNPDELPEGVNYWDQIVPTAFGTLYYAPDQNRDGTSRWSTNHGETRVTVEAGIGTVLHIDTDAADPIPDGHRDAYTMGLGNYNEIRRRETASLRENLKALRRQQPDNSQ